jgi:uncharacterized membrane protein YhaH (DUF805 family)
MTATSYSVLGVPMQGQRARRRLVVSMYAVLAVFCAASMIFARTEPLFYSWTIYATMVVAFFVFGGTGRYGLIKPFPNKPPRPEMPMVETIRLQLDPMSAGTPDESSWRNDERELSRRDRAHYQAFQLVGLGAFVVLVLAAFGLRMAMGMRHPEWLTVVLVLNVIYGVALVASVLVVTLPAAIILWNEPDIDLD